jgi:hypothetical protein
MLHPIREIAHFMNCPTTPAHFINWAILCSFCAQFMNWEENHPVCEMGKSSWPVHKMGNFTDGV